MDSAKFPLNKGYVHFEHTVSGLPETVTHKGDTLLLKENFHVSLLCTKNVLAMYPDLEEDVLFESFSRHQDHIVVDEIVTTGEFRYVIREHDGRKSIIAMVDVPGLTTVFDKVMNDLDISIPYQPTHVTLYTLEMNKGIGVNSADDLDSMSTIIDNEQTLSILSELKITDKH